MSTTCGENTNYSIHLNWCGPHYTSLAYVNNMANIEGGIRYLILHDKLVH